MSDNVTNPLEAWRRFASEFLKACNLEERWCIIPVSNISLGTPEKDISENEFNSGF